MPRSKVSDEVAQAWQMWENRSMKMGEMAILMHYEDSYGTAAVVAAIHEAGKCDKYDHLTLRFIEAILNGKKKKLPEKNQPRLRPRRLITTKTFYRD